MIKYENLVVVKEEKMLRVAAGIAVPTASQDGNDWEATVKLEGLSNGGVYPVFGMDGVQTVLLAIRLLNELILSSTEFESGQISVLGDDGEAEVIDKSYFAL